LLPEAMLAADQLNATVVDMRWVKPMDETKILEIARGHSLLVTLEENAVAGGAGAAVNELLVAQSRTMPALNLGLPDEFIDHGAHSDQLAWTGLDAASILQRITTLLDSNNRTATLKFPGTVEVTLNRT
jgi:1-deoxy-D-xylulose-5-phosphate synthase